MKKILFTATRTDKYTGELYEKGTEREFEDKRADEIVKAGVAEYVKEEVKEEVIETAMVDKSNVETATPKRKRTTKAK